MPCLTKGPHLPNSIFLVTWVWWNHGEVHRGVHHDSFAARQNSFLSSKASGFWFLLARQNLMTSRRRSRSGSCIYDTSSIFFLVWRYEKGIDFCTLCQIMHMDGQRRGEPEGRAGAGSLGGTWHNRRPWSVPPPLLPSLPIIQFTDKGGKRENGMGEERKGRERARCEQTNKSGPVLLRLANDRPRSEITD